MKHLLAAALLASATLLSVPALTPAVQAAGPVERMTNPDYSNWARFKVGTSVKSRVVTDMGGQRNEYLKTTKLVSLNPNEAVLQITTNMRIGGAMNVDGQVMTMNIPAQIDRPSDSAQGPRARSGEDTLTVAGKRYRARWFETVIDTGGVKTTSKVWSSDEFPGKELKAESRMEGQVTGSTNTEVIELASAG